MEFIGTGLAMGLAALGIGLGQGIGLSKGLEGISSKIQTAMIVGMALMETIGILTFVIAIILSNKL